MRADRKGNLIAMSLCLPESPHGRDGKTSKTDTFQKKKKFPVFPKTNFSNVYSTVKKKKIFRRKK